jgi:hypothetical protein
LDGAQNAIEHLRVGHYQQRRGLLCGSSLPRFEHLGVVCIVAIVVPGGDLDLGVHIPVMKTQELELGVGT